MYPKFFGVSRPIVSSFGVKSPQTTSAWLIIIENLENAGRLRISHLQ